MNSGVRFKLSLMMFLEFFIWGAWLPLIFGYLPSLGFTSLQQSWILNAFALASFAGMFFSNQFADRNFAAEKFLAVSHFIGGLAILALFWAHSFWPFFLLMLVHCLLYVPTISITNSIAFANLSEPQKEFGPIRLWGTIGWIAASWPFVFILVDWLGVAEKVQSATAAGSKVGFVEWLGIALQTSKQGAELQAGVRWTFVAAGISSLMLAAFSLLLPHTPPRPAKEGEDRFALFGAAKLLAVPFVLALFVVTFFDACVHQCYFIWTNDFLKSVGVPANWVMPVMSIGQIAEIGTMAILGYSLKQLGWRNIMVLGILGHAIRFGVFALLPLPMLSVAVIMLHGVCYAFFFATVYIFVDEFFPKDARTSAQGIFNFLILGFGPFVANFIWPYVGEMVRTVDVIAEVRHEAGKEPVLTVKGMVLHAAVPGDKGKLELFQQWNDETPESKLVDLSAERRFSMAVKEPAPGTYKYRFKFIRESWFTGNKEVELKLPPLEVKKDIPVLEQGKEPPSVGVRDYDYQQLFLFPSGMAIFAALLLLLFFHPPNSQAEVAGAVKTAY